MKYHIKKLISLGLLTLLIIPLACFAHVKWFAESVTPVRPYMLSDIPVIFTILIGLFLISIGIYLEKHIPVSDKFQTFMEKFAPTVLSIASIGFGLAFIIFTVNGFIFAPNLPAKDVLGTVMLFVQGLAGVMILLGIYERIGGLFIIILFILGVISFGYVEMLDTLEMIGFALYAMIIGRPQYKIIDTDILSQITHHIHNYGYPLLRVGVGLNLIVLGFTEKIFAPSLTQNFLSTHPWNFMQSLGVSNYWFAFIAGSTEILLGVFFVLGLVTRITTVVLAGFLITTLYLLGPLELIGHLPHFSIAIVLLILGAGSRLVLVNHKK